MNLKILVHAKKIIVGIHYSENSKYFKSIVDTSVIKCDETRTALDIVSTKMANTIAKRLLINLNDKKVRYKIDCYILHSVLLPII